MGAEEGDCTTITFENSTCEGRNSYHVELKTNGKAVGRPDLDPYYERARTDNKKTQKRDALNKAKKAYYITHRQTAEYEIERDSQQLLLSPSLYSPP